MPDDEIVTCRIQIVILVFKSVDSLFVVVELSQVEFLLHIHHFNSASFIRHCENIAVFSDWKSRYILSEFIDFSDCLLFISVNDFKVSTLTDKDHIFVIVIWGDTVDWILLALVKDSVLVFFPEPLFVR